MKKADGTKRHLFTGTVNGIKALNCTLTSPCILPFSLSSSLSLFLSLPPSLSLSPSLSLPLPPSPSLFHTHSPTVSSTLRGLSTAYREQGREETAKELEKLTKEEVSRSQSCRLMVSNELYKWRTVFWSTAAGVGPGTARQSGGADSRGGE